jgi:hypothetical protein
MRTFFKFLPSFIHKFGRLQLVGFKTIAVFENSRMEGIVEVKLVIACPTQVLLAIKAEN